MATCSVVGCSNKDRIINGGKRITFHQFPLRPDLRLYWEMVACGKNWKAKERSVLCSEHFKEDDFNHNSSRRVSLKRGAVPVYKLPSPSDLLSMPKKNKLTKKRSVIPSTLKSENDNPELKFNLLDVSSNPVTVNDELVMHTLKVISEDENDLETSPLSLNRTECTVEKQNTEMNELRFDNERLLNILRMLRHHNLLTDEGKTVIDSLIPDLMEVR